MQIEINKCTKSSFSVIGKEGSTKDGNDFISKLWQDANNHFSEVEALAKKDENGSILGAWGLMSDFSRSFNTWEDNLSKGLYLAGIEVKDDAEAPNGWVKWTAPGYEYLYIKVVGDYRENLSYVLDYMKSNDIKLAGAIFDYNCHEEKGQPYLFFPIRRL